MSLSVIPTSFITSLPSTNSELVAQLQGQLYDHLQTQRNVLRVKCDASSVE